jgi:hypothetical protein
MIISETTECDPLERSLSQQRFSCEPEVGCLPNMTIKLKATDS